VIIMYYECGGNIQVSLIPHLSFGILSKRISLPIENVQVDRRLTPLPP
jgi:hypothetical protein